MTGRPTKITEAVVAKLERSLENGFTINKACSLSGISYDAFNERYKKDDEFRQKIDLAKDWATEKARQVVIKSIINGNLKTAKWWLERKARSEFSVKFNEPVDEHVGLFNVSQINIVVSDERKKRIEVENKAIEPLS